MVVENEEIKITFSLRSLSLNTLTSTNKNMIDLVDIVMYNNVLMDSVTIYNLKLKRKEDIIHTVSIEC
jgi:hypothetical protein